MHVQHNTRGSSGSPLPQKMALRSLKEHASDDIQKQRGKLSFAKLVMNITSQRAVLFGAHYGWTGLWHVPQPLHLRQYACSLSFKSFLCLKNRGRSCKPKGGEGGRWGSRGGVAPEHPLPPALHVIHQPSPNPPLI